jgi:anti-sigma regulatory factor (Ser/Thr protein kinase)
VVSELVTNAVLHAGGTAGVRVLDGDGRIRVEVDDVRAYEPPRERSTTPDDVTGRGLQIVGQLSERWGVEHHQGRKTVWCEMTPGSTAAFHAG